jgi:hypothetical protein
MPYTQYIEPIYKAFWDYPQNIKSLKTLESTFITGEPRTGKTFLAIKYLRQTIESMNWNDSIAYDVIKIVRHSDLLNLATSSKTSDNGSQDRRDFKKIKECGLLIWDDLGSVKTSDFRDEIIFEIIDYRVVNDLPTVITSNLSLDALGVLYTERISGRIRDLCQNKITLKNDILKIDSNKIQELLESYKIPVNNTEKDLLDANLKNNVLSVKGDDKDRRVRAFKDYLTELLKFTSSLESSAILIARKAIINNPKTYNEAFGDIELDQLFLQIKQSEF